MDRRIREQREDELRGLTRELDTAQELLHEGVQLFTRMQDVVYEYASRHELFEGEVQRVLERNQDEFYEVKRDGDRLVEQRQEEIDALRRTLNE